MTQFTARFVSRKPHLRTVVTQAPIVWPVIAAAPKLEEPTDLQTREIMLQDLEQQKKSTLAQTPAMQAYFAKKATQAAESVFTPSVEQQAYFDWIKEGWGSALVQAVAGSGKTTTLVQGLPYMHGTIFFGAFGKDAATDIQAKARKAKVDRQGIRMSTMHSAGFGAFRQAFPRVAVDERKVFNLIKEFAQQQPPPRELIERTLGFIGKMVSYARQYLFGVPGYPDVENIDEWKALCEHFSADADLVEEVTLDEALGWSQTIFERSRKQCETLIDFDDMIYAPIAYGCKFYQNDWVIGDEWQDSNPARREIARRLLKPRGRAVFVGDDRQSIFGFTGASHDSLDVTAKMFDCQRLSLSVTYRCPKTVVEFVKTEIDPTYTIRAHEHALDGAVRPVAFVKAPTGSPQTPWFQQDAPSLEDAILCRYTKPLIATAYAMIKNGIACKVEGRDLGKNLIALARMWKITNLRTLKERLSVYLAREVEKARAQNSEKREQEITDRVETLGIFIERCETMGKTLINDVVAEIEALFADNVTDMIRLSTGHKSKGREWPRVFWLRTSRRQQRKEWETISERNIEIVIGTRPLGELIMVPEEIYMEKRK